MILGRDSKGKFLPTITPRQRELSEERQAEYDRKWSKKRYRELKGTPEWQKYYGYKPIQNRFRYPMNYEQYKLRERMKKRVRNLILGRSKGGISMRCDCGKEVKTCIYGPDEAYIFRELIGNLCILH